MVQISNAYAKRGSTLHDVAAVNSTPTMFELLIAHSAGLEDNDALHSAAEARRDGDSLLVPGVISKALGRRQYYPSSSCTGRGLSLNTIVCDIGDL